ncbi:MAG: hypothetical protein KTR21_12510 [Rhodobacteraceae bacterium]|nr:hypothetical protein [Paracoccaceae bacterium]
MIFARLAAVFYVLWGALHLYAAYEVYTLGQSLDPGLVQGRIFQDAWNLVFFALFGAAVGIIYVWRNVHLGHGLNLVVVSAGDIGFIVTILVPRHAPIMPGALGPLLWVIAAAFSLLAMSRGKNA